MKRIYCSLLVVMFVLLSPLSAYASTTESMLMYAPSGDEYAVMPLAAVDTGVTLTTGAGYYDLASDQWFFSDSVTVSNPFNTFAAWPILNYTSSKSTYAAGYYTLSGSGMPSVGDSWRIVCDNYRLAMYVDLDGDGSNEGFVEMTDNAVPFISEVEISYTGTVRNVGGDTYTSASTSEVIPFSSIFNGTGVYSWNKSGDITLTFSMPSKNYFRTDSYGNVFEYEWVSANIDSITFRTCYAINNANYEFYDGWFTVGDYVGTQFGWDDTRVYIIESESSISNESSVISAGLQSVNTSINNLGSSMSNQITNVNNNVNQVKTQITQSTNTITTKIDTMSQDIQTGLQNVVTSAQQNTQNIINTVTTKVDEVKTSVGAVKDAVVDLPNKLEEKAIGLVVPEEEVIADKFDDFTGTLEQELGILYEVPQMVYDLGDTITSNIAEPQKQMTFPALSLSMPDGQDYQIWGDIVFDIMPAGMEILQDFCMTITGLIMVTATVNAVKEQYELFIRDQKGR